MCACSKNYTFPHNEFALLCEISKQRLSFFQCWDIATLESSRETRLEKANTIDHGENIKLNTIFSIYYCHVQRCNSALLYSPTSVPCRFFGPIMSQPSKATAQSLPQQPHFPLAPTPPYERRGTMGHAQGLQCPRHTCRTRTLPADGRQRQSRGHAHLPLSPCVDEGSMRALMQHRGLTRGSRLRSEFGVLRSERGKHRVRVFEAPALTSLAVLTTSILVLSLHRFMRFSAPLETSERVVRATGNA